MCHHLLSSSASLDSHPAKDDTQENVPFLGTHRISKKGIFSVCGWIIIEKGE